MLPLTRKDHRIDNTYQIILQIIRSQDVIYLFIYLFGLLDHEVSQLIPKLLQLRSLTENEQLHNLFLLLFIFK